MRKFKKPFIGKNAFKRRTGKCAICGENRYKLLDVHRWREPGGKYENSNCICLCIMCHRLIHTNEIKILDVLDSTKGKIVHYIDLNGNEQFN